jgi:ParB-like chromosome segregation protein Spo0J
MNYKDHPLAELFPLMPDDELQALADDIKANGIKSKISIYEGKILDGRNRYRACKLAKVEPVFVEWKGKDPLAHVISLNLHRRQLTAGQRAIVAAKIADMPHGGNRTPSKLHDVQLETTRAEAAEQMHVGKRTVDLATAVIKASPEKAAEVAAGTKSLYRAAEEIKQEAAKPQKKSGLNLPVDDRGVTLPADLVGLWNRRGEFDEIAKLISKARVLLADAQKEDDRLFLQVEFSTLLVQLNAVYYSVTSTKPIYVCPMCQGQGCRTCKKLGLIGKFAFNQFVPAEMKKASER